MKLKHPSRVRLLAGDLVVALIVLSEPGGWAQSPETDSAPSPERIRAAVLRAIPLIESSMTTYPEKRDCFSCHHQAVPTIALGLLKDRGYEVAGDAIQSALEVTLTDLRSAQEAYRRGEGQGGGATRAGYALWQLSVASHEPDEVTEAVTEFLLKRDEKRVHWRSSSRRPPSEVSSFTTTALALRALGNAPPSVDQDRVTERVAKAGSWLLESKPIDTEDRVFRLWGLKFAGASKEEIASAARELLDTQREGGSWGPAAYRASDAYATGSALVALAVAGGVAPTDPAYQAGVRWLLGNQRPDGSWHVVSWSNPFQTYFESGFPHGKDQFISITASSWAAAALGLSTPSIGADAR
jgi:hypothetical protein